MKSKHNQPRFISTAPKILRNQSDAKKFDFYIGDTCMSRGLSFDAASEKVEMQIAKIKERAAAK